jgi:hypothetical protein
MSRNVIILGQSVLIQGSKRTNADEVEVADADGREMPMGSEFDSRKHRCAPCAQLARVHFGMSGRLRTMP